MSLFILYKDSYYLYFNFLPPLLSLSLPHFLDYFQKKLSLQRMVLPTFLLFFIFYTFTSYFFSYRTLGTFRDVTEIVKKINATHPSALYGVNDTTPALAFLSNTPLLNNIVDTNTNIFRKGLLNAKELTADAIKQKALVIVHGTIYPEYGVNETVADEIVDKKTLLTHCKMILSQPVYTEGFINRINLFSCQK